jgi:hypothetical protein
MYGKSFHVKQNGTTSKVKLLLNYYNWIAVQTLLDEWAAFFAHEWLLPEEHIFLTKFKLAFGTQIGISLTLVGTQNTAQRRGETITYSRGGKLVLPCKLVLRDVLLVHHSFWRLPCRVMESLAPRSWIEKSDNFHENRRNWSGPISSVFGKPIARIWIFKI